MSKKAAGALEERLPPTVAPVVPNKSRMSQAYDMGKQALKTTGSAIAATPRALSTAAGATRGAFTGMSQAYAKGKQAGTKYVGQGELSWDDIQVELANLSVEDAKALLSFVNQLGVTAAEPAPAPAPAPAPGATAYEPSDVQIANLVRDVQKAPNEVLSRFVARTDLHPKMKAVLDAEIAKRASRPPAPTPADASGSGAAGKVPGYTGRKVKLPTKQTKTLPTKTKKKKLREKIVAETLTWSKNFDPSRHLIKQIRRT